MKSVYSGRPARPTARATKEVAQMEQQKTVSLLSEYMPSGER